MDDDLRASLWNSVHARFGHSPTAWLGAAEMAATYVLKQPVDSFHRSEQGSREWLRDSFFRSEWYEVYEMMELFVHQVDAIQKTSGRQTYVSSKAEFMAQVDWILANELSGYRFVGGILAPISNQAEVTSIETAAKSGTAAAEHMRTALELLGKKPSPDYRNSIKESICAVESCVSTLAGTDPNGVSKALDLLGKKIRIHQSLKGALKQLYGYTSDEDGVRHAIMDEKEVGYAEAAFMLVSCSAFVNFFQEKDRQASGR